MQLNTKLSKFSACPPLLVQSISQQLPLYMEEGVYVAGELQMYKILSKK